MLLYVEEYQGKNIFKPCIAQCSFANCHYFWLDYGVISRRHSIVRSNFFMARYCFKIIWSNFSERLYLGSRHRNFYFYNNSFFKSLCGYFNRVFRSPNRVLIFGNFFYGFKIQKMEIKSQISLVFNYCRDLLVLNIF